MHSLTSKDLLLPSGAFGFDAYVFHVRQMNLRLSACPSLSISPDIALTAVQRPLSMCQQTVNPVDVLSDNPPCCSLSLDSPHLPSPSSSATLFSSLVFLFISLQPIKIIPLLSPACLLWSPKAYPVVSLILCHNPCPQCFTPSYPTEHNPPIENHHLSHNTSSSE